METDLVFPIKKIWTLNAKNQIAPVVKNLPANAGDIRDAGLVSGSGRSLEESKATHSSILAWRIPWTDEPCRLQSMGSQSQTWLKPLSTHTHKDGSTPFLWYMKTPSYHSNADIFFVSVNNTLQSNKTAAKWKILKSRIPLSLSIKDIQERGRLKGPEAIWSLIL